MPQSKYEYPFKTDPFQHQLNAWEQSKDCRYYAFLMEMGTGKTKVAIDSMAYLYDKGRINAAMVFANKGSYMNWITPETGEIPTHMPEHILYSTFPWQAATSKGYETKLQEFLCNPEMVLKIFVMNIEALAYQRSFDIAYRFVSGHDTLTIIDESSTIKNPKAERTKAAMKLRDVSKARRIMTGSAITNSPLDVYSQMEFLREGILGFTSFYSFKAHFAELVQMRMNQRTFMKVVGFKNTEELTQLLSENAFIVKKKDCLDLPEKIYETYNVEFSPEQKRMYSEMKENAIVELDNEHVVTAKMVLTKMLRMHQICCGFIQEQETTHKVENTRLETLVSILEELQGKAIIWATYRYNIIEIAAKLREIFGSETVVTYFGDTSTEDREYAKKSIQYGKARFLVGNPQTAGYGLTLTEANTHIYYSNNWNFDIRGQSEDRSHRIGQKNNVTYIDMIIPKTIDELILKSLRKKKTLANEIIVTNWRQYFE